MRSRYAQRSPVAQRPSWLKPLTMSSVEKEDEGVALSAVVWGGREGGGACVGGEMCGWLWGMIDEHGMSQGRE